MIWEVHPDGPLWSLRRTFEGRVLEALRWAAIAGAATFGFGLVYFGIERLGRDAVGLEVHPHYFLTVAAFAGFGAFLGFLGRMFRYWHWVIDREARTLAHSVRRVFADARVHEVSFDEIECIRIGPKRVVARFKDGDEVELARSFGRFGFDGVERGLRRAFDDTGLDAVTME